MKTTDDAIQSISAQDYEALCKIQKDCFECIPDDDVIIKPYFDIDYHVKEDEEYDETTAYKLLFYGLLKLFGFYKNRIQIIPDFAVAEANGTKIKDGESFDFYSFHINILNINTTKKTLKSNIDQINNEDPDGQVQKLLNKIIDIGDNPVFDTTVYSLKRKMRSVHCCKKGEPNRPFKLISLEKLQDAIESLRSVHNPFSIENACVKIYENAQISVSDKFNDMLISVYINEENAIWKPAEPEPKKQPTPKRSTTDTAVASETSVEKMQVNMFMDRGLMTAFSKDYANWINVGFILKNTFTDDEGWELFDKFCRLAGTKYSDLQYIENKTVWDSWKSKDQVENPIGMGSLIKMLEKDHKKELKEIQKECKKHIKTTKQKQHEDTDVLIELDPTKLDHFDSEYMNSFKNSYKNQKNYFESFISKVLRPEPQYIYIEGAKDIGKTSCIFSETNITTAFKHIKTNKTVGDETKECSFTKLWLNDGNIKCYNKLDFIPYNGFAPQQTEKTVYNLFTGYNPKIYTEYNKEKKDIILKPFKDLGIELCGGNITHFNYFYAFLAHMIQKPNEKVPICFIFKGKQGTGKNVFLNAVGNIIGADHYISSANPKDFFGDYAEGFYHKLLVNMNECEGKDTFDFEGKIKSFITEDTITINPKNVRPTQIQNVARTIIFTNKPNPIPIDVKSIDRRFCVFKTTDKYLEKKYGRNFWTKLVEHFNKPEFIACLYDDLNGIDFTKIDWRVERPITEAYKEMCKLYVPVLALFFENYTNRFRGSVWAVEDGKHKKMVSFTTEQNHKNKEVYEEYVVFCKEHGFSSDKSFQTSIQKFNGFMTELEIPHIIVKSYGINEFRFTPKAIYDHLLAKKWINRGEDDDPEIVIEDVAGDDFDFEI
jgi:hypothetical protein